MNIQRSVTYLSGALLLAMTVATLAQEHTTAPSKGGKASPHQQIATKLGGKAITIVYGRPYKKDRKVFGGLAPYGQVWRTGADEATTLTTEGDIVIGTLAVPAGTYSMFTLPNEKEWTLILNKTVNQWGAFKYDQGQDFGRTAMKVQKLSAPVEQFTISLPVEGNQGTLRMAWDDTAASVVVKPK